MKLHYFCIVEYIQNIHPILHLKQLHEHMYYISDTCFHYTDKKMLLSQLYFFQILKNKETEKFIEM